MGDGASTKNQKLLQFTDPLVVNLWEVPRIEDKLIDDLFYQEDEIGDMRYFSFMVECGIEEDPIDDGPDIAPIPWLFEQLSKEEQSKLFGGRNELEEEETYTIELKDEEVRSKTSGTISPTKRRPPARTRSMDEFIQKFKQNTASTSDDESSDRTKPINRRPTPRRRQGGSASRRRNPPKRSPSMDAMLQKFQSKTSGGDDGGQDTPPAFRSTTGNESAPRRRPPPRYKNQRRIEDADSATKEKRERPVKARAPPRRGKLAFTQSGSDLGHMKDRVRKTRASQKQQQESTVNEGEAPKVPHSPTKPFREVRGKLKLTATKSGSLHHMRATLRQRSSAPKRTDGRRGSGTFTGIQNLTPPSTKTTDDHDSTKSATSSTKVNSDDSDLEDDTYSQTSEDVSIESD